MKASTIAEKYWPYLEENTRKEILALSKTWISNGWLIPDAAPFR